VFGFIQLKGLVCAARTCKAWLAVAAKEKPRGQGLALERAERLADLCASSSPFNKHISRVGCDFKLSLSLEQLAQLSQLPELTTLRVQPNAPDLSRLMDEEGGGALAALQAAFPPKLRELTLCVSGAHSTAACQLLLDALPVTAGLEWAVLDQRIKSET